jgi:hypothetical protein
MSDLNQGGVSFFDSYIKNLIPSSQRSLKEIHDIIKSPLLVEPTKACRNAPSKEALKTAKNQLPSISPCGSFSKRYEDGLISTSGFLAIEIENINPEDINENKKRILGFVLIPTALIFTSPSGKGINWNVPMPKNFKGTRNAHKAITLLIKKKQIEKMRCKLLELEPKDKFCDNADILQRLKFSERTLATWCEKNIVRFSKIGNKVYYKKSEILNFFEEHSSGR